MKKLFIICSVFISLSVISCATNKDIVSLDKNSQTNSEPEPVVKDLSEEELVSISIKETLDKGPISRVNFGGQTISLDSSLSAFYSQNSYKPVWYDKKGFENSRTKELIKILNNSALEGLNPNDYNISIINQSINSDNYSNTEEIANLDLIFSSSLLTYSKHLLYGNPKIGKFNFEQPYIELQINLTSILNKAISQNRLDETLNSLKPVSPVYKNLVIALVKYSQIQQNGGWPSIKEGVKLKAGSIDPRVAILRRRLIITGDLTLNQDGSEIDINSIDNKKGKNPHDKFDSDVENAVKKFQHRHNLLADGIVGKSTIDALNIPVEERIRQIKISLDMWRKLPIDLGNKFVLVNIPFYKLHTFQNNRPFSEMKVVVGKNNWHTPIFSDEITYIEVNPYWNVPKSILIEDILPKAKEDPAYITRNNIKVLRNWESEHIEDKESYSDTNIQNVSWNEIDTENWPFRLRQDPGPDNPLGRLKFMFPNRHNVYLHDTPLKKYFDRTSRNLSHGCIRVERPLDLADFLLYSNPEWSSEQLEYQIKTGRNKIVSLNTPVPVHLMYFTAWADESNIYFTEDVYNIF